MQLPKDEVEARVTEALSSVGALPFADRPAHHLSGGEKRMVAIATVLAMRPQLVLYDEPSASLDIRSRRHLISLLQESQETILIASHDLELILEICDRVVLMDDGRIVADDNPHKIMGDEKLMEAHGQEKPHSLIPHQTPHHLPH
jgi:cobalt/nickel transport system ATP-binding protein